MLNAITGNEVYLYNFLKEEISQAKEIKMIVSFLLESGVKLIIKDLKKQALKGAKIQIITGTYLNITEPSALYLLKNELGEMVDLKLYNNQAVSFHPKAYFFTNEREKVLYIGSSNVSNTALTSGIEWNYRMVDSGDREAYQRFEQEFDRIFNKEAVYAGNKELRNYASSWKKSKLIKASMQREVKPEKPEPRGAQIEALYELKLAREEGIKKGLVAAATGVGKTYLAAFDSIDFNKVLFVAHREEILNQARDSFLNVDSSLKTSFFNGTEKDNTGDIVFASVQTLRNRDYLHDYFKPDSFDYIIIDEFHHVAADSYLEIVKYFEPEFLLGLTATPFRMDNKDIFEICNDNIIYEIDLKDAINRDLLVPFKYYGIYDNEVDYDRVKIAKGKYNIKDLEIKLSTHKRADLIIKNYKNMAGSRTLGFCASIDHANFMAEEFNKYNIRAVCVHSSASKSEYFMERDTAVEKLKNKEIDVIFAVDIFNEGVDIPSLDTVLFLRPTESYVVFLQQLGRGLRKYENKKHLKVLDFIGNYKRAHIVPLLLAGINPVDRKAEEYQKLDELDYPEDCQISFDLRVIDLFKEIRANDPLQKRMVDEYYRLKNYLKRRPLRKDIYEGIDIDVREYLRRKYDGRKGYLRFLNTIGELTEVEQKWLNTAAEDFLIELENTSMTKSYKMPTLYALIDNGELKSEVEIETVGRTFMDYYRESKLHQKDLNNKKHKNWQQWEEERFIKEAVQNPVKFLSKRKFFIHDEINKKFMLYSDLKPFLDEQFTRHFLDILRYRETRYFNRRFKS